MPNAGYLSGSIFYWNIFMKLSGQRNFKASHTEIWDLLMDPNVLARIAPGIDSLEPIGEDRYKASVRIKMGPVNGTFEGSLDIKNKVPLKHFTLSAIQKSKIGQVTAQALIELIPEDSGDTAIRFDGKADLTGFLARIGLRLLTGVANSLTQQFFDALEKEGKIEQELEALKSKLEKK